MRRKISLVDMTKLVCHERVQSSRVRVVCDAFKREGVVRRPIIVDRESMVILDGHHRFTALRSLGARRIPVVFVRYGDSRIRVYLRRKKMLMDMIKRVVVEEAKKGNVFPPKTTRHLIQDRPTMRAVAITLLKEGI